MFRWFCIEKVLASGRKIPTFVNPDLAISFRYVHMIYYIFVNADLPISFRSKVAVFEFIKFLGVYSGQDLEGFAKTMSIKAK